MKSNNVRLWLVGIAIAVLVVGGAYWIGSSVVRAQMGMQLATVQTDPMVRIAAALERIAAAMEKSSPSMGMMGQMGPGMMGGMMGGQPLPNGAAFSVLKVRVERQESETLTLPTKLSAITRHRLTDAVNQSNPRTFTISFNMGMMQMQWLLNERPFQMEEVAPNERVKLNTLEVWEFVNETSPMAMAHPIHIHGPLFQIIERRIRPERAAGWETVGAGYVDEGRKDTVLLMPGERVKILLKFENYTGLYVYHCHNLEHEDAGMMRNYFVSA